MEALRTGRPGSCPMRCGRRASTPWGWSAAARPPSSWKSTSPFAPLVIGGRSHRARCWRRWPRLLIIRVIVVDDRPEFAIAERLPGCGAGHPGRIRRRRPRWSPSTGGRRWSSSPMATSTTRRRWPSVLSTDAAWYIGMIGSRAKVRAVFAELAGRRGAGGGACPRPRPHRPGPGRPDARRRSALSILAQIVAVAHGRSGDHLRGVREASASVSARPVALIKGAGDLATGVAVRLHRAGFDVLMTEVERPTVGATDRGLRGGRVSGTRWRWRASTAGSCRTRARRGPRWSAG